MVSSAEDLRSPSKAKVKKVISKRSKTSEPDVPKLIIQLNSEAESPCTSTDINNNQTPAQKPEQCSVPTYHWEDNVIRLFLEQYKRNEFKFKNVNYRNKEIWENIAADMKNELIVKGHKIFPTGPQCENRWKSMTKR